MGAEPKPADEAPDLLEDPRSFWDSRHRTFEDLAAGGDKGLSEGENYEFYVVRLGRLIELLRRHLEVERPFRLLDAGCGRGYFTDGLSRAGHDVVGIDFSEHAIAEARSHCRGRFEVGELHRIGPHGALHETGTAFDAVFSIDVLFHIVDDALWSETLRQLASAVRTLGVLILTDAYRAERFQLSDYIVHRSADEYRVELRKHGFGLVEVLPYAFGSNPNRFAVFRR